MSGDKGKYQGMYCCTVPMAGVRMLTFPDGTQSGVVGLEEIFADMHRAGRVKTPETGEAMVEMLATRNYIVPSARSKYASLLLEEYDKYVQMMEKGPSATGARKPDVDRVERKRGLLSKLLKAK
ncbi:MAG TPA: hypothetical protein DCR97_14825 [Deltaproteobacteria bacterium]|nr:hypothetical protein [Deltaproteobacteria bacterium]